MGNHTHTHTACAILQLKICPSKHAWDGDRVSDDHRTMCV